MVHPLKAMTLTVAPRKPNVLIGASRFFQDILLEAVAFILMCWFAVGVVKKLVPYQFYTELLWVVPVLAVYGYGVCMRTRIDLSRETCRLTLFVWALSAHIMFSVLLAMDLLGKWPLFSPWLPAQLPVPSVYLTFALPAVGLIGLLSADLYAIPKRYGN